MVSSDKTINKTANIYRLIIENEPIGFTELLTKTGIGRTTLTYHLAFLGDGVENKTHGMIKGIGVIEKNSTGAYQIRRRWVECKTDEEYRQRLKHSKRIVDEIESYKEEDYVSPIEISRELEDHLKIGYPRYYNLFQDYVAAHNALQRCRKQVLEHVATIAETKSSHLYQMLYSHYFHTRVVDVLIDNFAVAVSSYTPKRTEYSIRIDRMYDKLKNTHGKVDGSILRSEEQAFTRIENEFVADDIDQNLFNSYFEKLVEWELQRSKLKEKLLFLYSQIQEGNILKGACDLCPRVAVRSD